MAYDQGGAYEPPRRPYYQHAPVQSHYQPHPQHYDDHGGGYDQAYDQGYGHPQQAYGAYDEYGQNASLGYDQYYGNGGMPDGNGYEQHDQPQPNGYGQAREGPRMQPNGRGAPPTNGHAPAPQGRHYDPKYQQRPHANRPLPQEQNYGPRVPPKGPPTQYHQGRNPRERRPDPRDNYINDVGMHQSQPQPCADPRNGYGPPPSRTERFDQGPPMQQKPDPRNGYPAQSRADLRNGHSEPQSRRERPNQPPPGSATRQSPPKTSAPQPSQQAPPAMEALTKTTMEEWKANERAKMHAAANKPKVVPQDNAFPTFPAKKKEPRAGGESAMSSRVSEEQARPATSGSTKPQERRPGTAGSSRHQPSPPQSQRGAQQLPRPSGDGQPRYEQQGAAMQTYQEPQDYQQPLYNGSGMASAHQAQHHPQAINGQIRPQDSRANLRQPQRPDAEYMQYDENPRQQMARGPPMQAPAFDTPRAPMQQPGAAENHTMSPVRAAPGPYAEPSPAQWSSQHSQPWQTESSRGYDGGHMMHEPNGTAASGYHRKQAPSVEDVLDGYLDPEPAPAPPVQPRNREEEIEMEMPDFDSAAPKQTNVVHKRVQTVDKDLGGSRSAPPDNSANASALQKHYGYGHLQDAATSSQPELRDGKQNHGGIADGFVFGIPGEQLPPQPHYDTARSSPAQQQMIGYPPTQPPFTDDMRETRSMDGQRPTQMQMPMRGGPPPMHPQGHRFHPNGRGPLPPHHRPDFDRNPTMQSAMSDPGQMRTGSAPPMRPGFQEPPPHRPSPLGASVGKQRSAPEAPQIQRQERHSNPDTLPAHPVPVRQGLNHPQGTREAPKPAPVRNHDNKSVSSSRGPSLDISDKPVTRAELKHLLSALESSGSPKVHLIYAKKLAEASTVLASEGGRADPKTTQRNRERYTMDAYKRVKKLVADGYPDALFYLADCYGQGALGLDVDTKEAFNLYQTAAKGGHAEAAYRTAVCCEMGPEQGGGTRQDLPKAVQWYRRAAALGDTAAMFKLGMILLKGLLAQPRNVGESVTWLKRAAEHADGDNPHALHELGLLYEPGNTNPEVRSKVAADEPYALSLYRQAADFGYKQSLFRLGQAYEYGTLGLPIDNRQSISFYSKAAAKGEHQAELALSGWYLTGAEGILEHSETEAYLWARKAALSEPPLAKALFAMGYFSEQGIGCPQNVEEAKRWYGRAASYKFPKAVERLEEMKKSGSRKPAPANGKLTRKDQKRDEENCVVM